MAGGFLSSMAGTVVGSMIAQHFFSQHPEANHLFGNDAGQTGADSGYAGDAAQGAIHDPFASADTGNDTSNDLAGVDNADLDNGDLDSGDFDGGFDSGDSFDV